MLTELRTKSQITIPKDIVNHLGLAEGDKLEVRFGARRMVYEVVTLSEHVLKSDANGMYRLISDGTDEQ